MGPTFPLLRLLFESSVSLLAPDVCAGCDERIGVLRVFCPACAATLLPPPPSARPRADEIAAFAYGGALAAAITSLKYGGRVDRARPLSHLLLRAVTPLRVARDAHDALPTLVLPVPLHRARLIQRGYNHAALLAAPVARHLGARFATSSLVRTRDTPAQATLGRSARLHNVRDAFVFRPGARPVEGERVLLVDDVRTTGATLEACASALRDAGAAQVRTLVLAAAEGD